jgi:hypothetical protein
MKRFRRRAARFSAVESSSRRSAYFCEPLKRRVMLNASDPVLVLVEEILELGDIHTKPLTPGAVQLPPRGIKIPISCCLQFPQG